MGGWTEAVQATAVHINICSCHELQLKDKAFILLMAWGFTQEWESEMLRPFLKTMKHTVESYCINHEECVRGGGGWKKKCG